MFSPSVSSTITAGAKAPRGAVPSAGTGCPGPDSGATRFSAVITPLPSDVALCGSRRSMVASQRPAIVGRRLHDQAALSEGYDADPGATGPPLNEGLLRRASQLPSSWARRHRPPLLDDTSNASTTVPSTRGNGSVSSGRAEASARTVTAIRKMMGGT